MSRARPRPPPAAGSGVTGRRGRPSLRGGDRLGDPPVDHPGLAVAADEDVVRLEVPVEVPAVGVIDGAAGEDEPAEQLAQAPRPGPLAAGPFGVVQLIDGRPQGLPLPGPDEPHGVAQVAVGAALEAVDGDDPGVLQEAGGLGLEEELVAVGRVVAVLLPELLEGDQPRRAARRGEEDVAQAAAGVEIEHAVARGLVHRGEPALQHLDQGIAAGRRNPGRTPRNAGAPGGARTRPRSARVPPPRGRPTRRGSDGSNRPPGPRGRPSSAARGRHCTAG